MSFVAIPRTPKKPSVFLQAAAASLGGVVLFLLLAMLFTGGYDLLFTQRIFPGISMAGVDLSSMTQAQAEQALNQRLTFPSTGRIVLKYGSQIWLVKPSELGMVFDASLSVQHAYNLGRKGGPLSGLANQLNAWQGGLELSPVIVLDERVAYGFLQNIARQIDQPMVEADLHLEGTQVSYAAGQTGRLLNVDKTMDLIVPLLHSFKDGEVDLSVEEQAPLITDASVQADGLRAALNAPLTLTISNPQAGDPGPWTINPDTLAGMLSIERIQQGSSWTYQVSVSSTGFEDFLQTIAPQLDQAPENARFYFDDPTGQLVLVQPAKIGRNLDIGGSRDAIVKGLLNGQHSIPLAVNAAKPAVTDDATAASLGIDGLVASDNSYFRGSGTPRLQNIKAASEKFHGMLIPPNATFSMGDAIGDISLDNGYAEALIIYNGQTITGVGGGVCQVSTTLFRTAFFGGYPIVERHFHAYRVYYYEQTANGTDPRLAGLDATVYFPLVDLKFTNDRPYWLLMETYFDPVNYTLTWKFYSGGGKRDVDVQNLGLRNVVPAPAPRFEENADLAPNEIKQVDWSGDGADITVTRSVSQNGQVIFTDNIQTSYEPWQAVCQYGPGTDNPEALAAQAGICQ
jgi:vancomycin resistance protein YoaR